MLQWYVTAHKHKEPSNIRNTEHTDGLLDRCIFALVWQATLILVGAPCLDVACGSVGSLSRIGRRVVSCCRVAAGVSGLGGGGGKVLLAWPVNVWERSYLAWSAGLAWLIGGPRLRWRRGLACCLAYKKIIIINALFWQFIMSLNELILACCCLNDMRD